MKNPMQPIIRDHNKVIRFKSNAIVEALLEHAHKGKKLDLNDIAWMEFSQDDRCQFAQLIGYSLDGYHELSYVSDNHAKAASEAARAQLDIKPDQPLGCRDVECEIHCGIKEE